MQLSNYSRIVIKIGSSLLVDSKQGLKQQWLANLTDDVGRLAAAGAQIIIVSSGAIALGRNLLGLPRGTLKLEENQAAAATGQIELCRQFSQALGNHNLTAGQILLTLGDTEQRRRYLNARATITTLLRLKAIPVINENDSVATSEIRYGDNDRLAARVASMMSADLLVLLSDVDGLYSRPPSPGSSPDFVKRVDKITPQIDAMAGDAGSELSRGGMVTKIEAAKIATAAGADMIIASGREHHPLSAIIAGAKCTLFKAQTTAKNARKNWIAGQLQMAGEIAIDAGAQKALQTGKSLLPAGVKSVSGAFQRGDTVSIVALDGKKLGRGIIAYDAGDAKKIAGRHSEEILDLLGFSGRAEMIHRDDMALSADLETDLETNLVTDTEISAVERSKSDA